MLTINDATNATIDLLSRRARAFAVIAMALIAGSASGAASASEPDLGGKGPGSLVETTVVTDIDESVSALGATAVRVKYRSTSGRDGSSTVVSGMIFVPAGTPPPGGWPVLAHAHATAGINYECGPSLSRNMFGTAVVMAASLKMGYAVAAADYEGLGAPGTHLYLDAKTEAWNVIDSVRALRHFRPGTISDRWLVFGGSQGGAAAWATAEQAVSYAPELNLLGAAALVPPTDFSEYAQMAAEGSFNEFQKAAYIWMLMTQSRVNPKIDLDLYRHGSAKANWQALSYCFGPHEQEQERAEALQKVTAEELKPTTPAATERMAELFKAMALPQQAAKAPMLVIYAGKDEFIKPQWTRTAIQKACAMGTKIQEVFLPDKGHAGPSWEMSTQWLNQRLAGEPFQDTCSQKEEDFPTGYSDGPRLPGSQWRVHDEKRPRPAIVTPAATEGKPPSDAVVLFDGTGLKEWVSAKDGSSPKWKVEDGVMQVVAGTGDIVTKESFGDSQLHIEFATPALPINRSQWRGNSGVFLYGLYEVQILDGYQNLTYADGEASAIFGQSPPLVNASRPSGEWQSFDIVYTGPRFKDGKVTTPGYVTVFHNGVITQNHTQILGTSVFKDLPGTVVHGPKGPIKLQDHTYPVRFRNIWIRPLQPAAP
ncbi:MAG TPA: family 16 glycoside hydrolase [Steroidobacter sp.]